MVIGAVLPGVTAERQTLDRDQQSQRVMVWALDRTGEAETDSTGYRTGQICFLFPTATQKSFFFFVLEKIVNSEFPDSLNVINTYMSSNRL